MGEGFGGGRIDMFEGVGSFVADSRKAELADMEEVVEEGGLFEADVFDVFEADDVEGAGEEGGGGVLDEALIGNEEDVGAIDIKTNEASEKNN